MSLRSCQAATWSPSPGQSGTVEVTVHRCINVPADLTFGILKKRNFFVEVTTGSEGKRTRNSSRNGHQLVWNEKFSFDTAEASTITLSLYSDPTLVKPKQIGHHTFYPLEAHANNIAPTLKQVVLAPKGPEIQYTLNFKEANVTPGGSLEGFNSQPKALREPPSRKIQQNSINGDDNVTAAQEILPTSKVDVTPHDPGSQTENDDSEMEPENLKAFKASDEAAQAVESLHTLSNLYKRILEGVLSFRDIVGGIAEVHPYAKLASAIFFAIPGPLIEQLGHDEDVKTLLNAILSLCDIVKDSKALELGKHERLRGVLKRASLQLTEVAYFVSQYCKVNSFFKRAVKNKLFGTGDIIREYQAKLGELKDEFRSHLEFRTGVIVAETRVKVVRVLQAAERIADSIDLNDIAYVAGAGLNRDKICLLGTRTEILEEIAQWISSEGPRTLLLCGGAGTGKSSIAHTIAAHFKELGRLGSMYCFNETDQAARQPTSLFPQIARDLADLDENIRAELCKAIQDNRADRKTSSIATQFETLVLAPARAISDKLHGPIVIVIDALDESGKRKERERLLQVLGVRLKELPENFRIIITSRPELDIEMWLPNGRDILVKKMDAIPQELTTKDITAYVELQFAREPTINSEMCRTLSYHAHGLFQWARVACDFIRFRGFGEDPLDRYNGLIHPLASNTGSEIVGDNLLDYLYRSVLSKTLPVDRENGLANFKFVMGRVLAALEPLSRNSLNQLIAASKAAPRGCTAEKGIAFLGSLLSGLDSPNIPIRPLHTSFRDFLKDSKRSDKFFIDLSSSRIHFDMAWASLSIMSRGLKFNICQLPTSHLANKDIPGIAESIQKNISPHLSYTSRFWASHLWALPATTTLVNPGDCPSTTDHERNELVTKVEEILCNYILYWLEVLSLLDGFDIALDQIRRVYLWAKQDDAGQAIILLIEDLERFCLYFAKCITRSAPHIYISALPFAPNNSLVAAKYKRPNDRTLSVAFGKLEAYPSCLNIITGHTKSITSVAFSPDGTRIASGSIDTTIRVWNSQSGEMILGPLQGHTEFITSIAYSPDGNRIASTSSDKTIRIWNAYTGEIEIGPLEGHTDAIQAITFSPDGNLIVSGSTDHTARIWNVQRGEMLLGPLQGHTDGISSISFSPNGRLFATGSEDSTIRVWDVQSGGLVLGPLTGHKRGVCSVAFSPDSTVIASSCLDGIIRTWSVSDGAAVLKPLKAHDDRLFSLTFSPDGTRIASGSLDCTIRIWSVQDHKLVFGPLRGHTGSVDTVAFSPDGSRIASGSRDDTIRIWDVLNNEVALESAQGHTGTVTSVAFSPDGTRIASASCDKTIQICNILNAKIVVKTFQGHTLEITSLVFSPDGTHIASGSRDNTIRIWDAQDNNKMVELLKLEGHTDWIVSIVFSQDGASIASCSRDNTIRIWDIQTGQVVIRPLIKQGQKPVILAAFSPDVSRLVSNSGDKGFQIWNAQSGELLVERFKSSGHKLPITAITFSPDGIHFATGCEEGSVKVRNIQTGKSGPRHHRHLGPISTIAFSSDGNRVASTATGFGVDESIRVWDAQSGDTTLVPLGGHESVVTAVAFSPDGTRLVSGSTDKTVWVWNVQDDETVFRPIKLNITGTDSMPKSLAAYIADRTAKAQILEGTRMHVNDLSVQFPSSDHPGEPSTNTTDAAAPSESGLIPQDEWGIKDGWILGPDGELLFYVPPGHQEGLSESAPRTVLVMSSEHHVALDMSRYAHGSRWTESFSIGNHRTGV